MLAPATGRHRTCTCHGQHHVGFHASLFQQVPCPECLPILVSAGTLGMISGIACEPLGLTEFRIARGPCLTVSEYPIAHVLCGKGYCCYTWQVQGCARLVPQGTACLNTKSPHVDACGFLSWFGREVGTGSAQAWHMQSSHGSPDGFIGIGGTSPGLLPRAGATKRRFESTARHKVAQGWHKVCHKQPLPVIPQPPLEVVGVSRLAAAASPHKSLC